MFNTAPNELKLVLWIKSGKVIIPTKFEGNLKTSNFYIKFMHYVIVYTFYGLEIYEIYRVNCHGLVMNKIYKKIAIHVK